MIAKTPKQPIRPPHPREARKARCPLCGRRPIFFSHAARSDGRARTDKSHELCPACQRRLRDRARAALERRRGVNRDSFSRVIAALG